MVTLVAKLIFQLERRYATLRLSKINFFKRLKTVY
jgi:hypothetical protein